MTQPAVSQQIQTLEETIGKPLIDRDVRPLQLTHAGKILHQQAPLIIEQIDKTIALMHRCKGHKIPELALGITSTFPGYVLPVFLKQLSKYIDTLSVHSDISMNLIQKFLDRELSIILSGEKIEDQTKVEEYHIISEPMVAIYPERFFKKNVIPTISELSTQFPFISFPGNCQMYTRIQRYLGLMGVKLKQRIEVNSTTEVMTMVDAGMGWAVTTPLIVTVGKRNHSIANTKNILLPKPGIMRDLFLYAQTDELGDLPQQTAQLLKTILKQHCLPDLVQLTPSATEYIQI